MKIGVFFFSTEYAIRVDELAAALEARNFESLFLCEHTHIPASRKSPFPAGGELPKQYIHTLDPFVALTAAAAATERLRLGTGICLVPQRDPIVTAKAVASLDLLSNGRFEFAIGAGWNAEEMENHGHKFDQRYRLMVERTQAMKVLWTEDEASFEGEFTNFENVWSYPKPVQKPHPPILFGGETRHTMRRVVEFGDGWFPRARNSDPVDGMPELRQLAAEAGRDMATISTSVFAAPADQATVDRYQEAGIDRALFVAPSESRDTVLPLLDEYAKLIG